MFPRSRSIVRLVGLASCGAVLLSAVTAAAQTSRPGRPYRGLFGPGEKDPAQVLSVNGMLGMGYDTDVVAEQREHGLDTSTTFLRTADVFGLFVGGISYVDHGARYDFSSSLTSAARNYSRFATVSSHAGSVSGSVRVSRRTTVTASQTAVYEPLGMLFRFPTFDAMEQVLPSGQDFAVVHGAYTSYATVAAVSQELTRRSSLSATYSYQTANIQGSDGGFRNRTGGIRYAHNVARNTAWHAGYGYTETRYLSGEPAYRGNTLDAGVDYSRDLSVSRRTHLSFGTGATGLSDHHHTRYVATGTAVLDREIGRTWQAALVYARSVGFFETLRAPYFYDEFSVRLAGLLSRRLAFHSSAGTTFGDISVSTVLPESNQFTTAYANVGMIVALSRYFGIGGDYVVYGYSVNDASIIRGGLLRPELTRHSVTVSLRAWAPVLERGRRPNAAR